jgi:hypothetical protein
MAKLVRANAAGWAAGGLRFPGDTFLWDGLDLPAWLVEVPLPAEPIPESPKPAGKKQRVKPADDNEPT